MTPGQAAHAVGVTYATAKRWYDRWGDEIRQNLESRLLPSLEAFVKRVGKKPVKHRAGISAIASGLFKPSLTAFKVVT